MAVVRIRYSGGRDLRQKRCYGPQKTQIDEDKEKEVSQEVLAADDKAWASSVSIYNQRHKEWVHLKRKVGELVFQGDNGSELVV